MKIGLIGTINKDSIIMPDGTLLSGWGGALYNLVAYDHLSDRNTNIYPVCNIGQDCFDDILKIVNRLKSVDQDYIKRVGEPNNHCHLKYSDQDDKTEILAGGVPRLIYNDMKPLLKTDIAHLNFISGRDVYLRSMQKFRKNYQGQIYIDIHSLTLGKRSDGSRYLRRPASWMKYFELADIIQLNRLEAGLLAFNDKSGQIPVKDSVAKIYSLLKAGKVDFQSKCIIITDNKRGCYLAYFVRSQYCFRHIKPKQAAMTGNTTGCGDCFGSGFVYSIISGNSFEKSAEMANQAALDRIVDEGNIYALLS